MTVESIELQSDFQESVATIMAYLEQQPAHDLGQIVNEIIFADWIGPKIILKPTAHLKAASITPPLGISLADDPDHVLAVISPYVCSIFLENPKKSNTRHVWCVNIDRHKSEMNNKQTRLVESEKKALENPSFKLHFKDEETTIDWRIDWFIMQGIVATLCWIRFGNIVTKHNPFEMLAMSRNEYQF